MSLRESKLERQRDEQWMISERGKSGRGNKLKGPWLFNNGFCC